MIKAFLLTRQSFDTSTGVQLVFWFQSEAGPIKVIVNAQQLIFFIRQQDMALSEELLIRFPDVEIKPLELKNFENEAMAGVYFKYQQQFYRGRDILQQNNIRCLEADVRAAERYLTERFLTGPVSIHSDEPAVVLVNPRITPDDYRPDLKLMSFDIETDYVTEALFSIAFVTGQHRRVLMIGERRTVWFRVDRAASEAGWISIPSVMLMLMVMGVFFAVPSCSMWCFVINGMCYCVLVPIPMIYK